MAGKINVINLKGEREPFSFKKVYRSAINAGASKSLALETAREIEKEIFDGISTSEIFKRIFEILSIKSPQSAIRFNLKNAMEKLGPAGFHFEKFVGKIFEAEGFEIKLNQIIPGYCTDYEIDFLGKKGKIVYIGECKYHRLAESEVDIQVALANYARFLDIERGKFLNSKMKYKSLLVTNTKFTDKAIKYSECVGVELLGWKYPKDRGLEKLIEKNKLYPITILPSVNQFLAQFLIEKKIILVKEILNPYFKRITFPKKEKVIQEARILLK